MRRRLLTQQHVTPTGTTLSRCQRPQNSPCGAPNTEPVLRVLALASGVLLKVDHPQASFDINFALPFCRTDKRF